ncbi:hypothetical protein [Nocardia flavorosea]|uniref:hypothetical protein n=1 Tax=Nocardia flavorosea TaxID=53429 RepID=UPI0024558DC4|nr:hypothetical protein [Nocardia flavorosea]
MRIDESAPHGYYSAVRHHACAIVSTLGAVGLIPLRGTLTDTAPTVRPHRSRRSSVAPPAMLNRRASTGRAQHFDNINGLQILTAHLRSNSYASTLHLIAIHCLPGWKRPSPRQVFESGYAASGFSGERRYVSTTFAPNRASVYR